MSQSLNAVEIAELAALRELVAPTNPLSRQLIDERLAADVPPDPLFMSQLQRAWRDGHLSPEELRFCEKMDIKPLVYLRMRQVAEPRKGESKLAAVRRRIFDLE